MVFFTMNTFKFSVNYTFRVFNNSTSAEQDYSKAAELYTKACNEGANVRNQFQSFE